MNDNKLTKSMLKSEYAEKLDISTSNLRKYLNVVFYDELKNLNYNKFQKILLPIHINFLDKKLCYSPD